MIKLTQEKELYTPAEIAEFLGVTPRTVQNWCCDPRPDARLQCFKAGRNITRVTREDLQDFIRRHFDQVPELQRTKYREKPKPRVDKAIREIRQRNANDTLCEFGVIK